MPSRFQDILKIQRENEETSRAGLKWEDDEDKKLLLMNKNGDSYADIAKALKRTEGSIKTRLIVDAINKMENDNSSIEEVATDFSLTVQDISAYIDNKAMKDERRRQKKEDFKQKKNKKQSEVTVYDVYSLLLNINKKLDICLSR